MVQSGYLWMVIHFFCSAQIVSCLIAWHETVQWFPCQFMVSRHHLHQKRISQLIKRVWRHHGARSKKSLCQTRQDSFQRQALPTTTCTMRRRSFLSVSNRWQIGKLSNVNLLRHETRQVSLGSCKVSEETLVRNIVQLSCWCLIYESSSFL